MDNRCIICGEIIPEGLQVCPTCERTTTVADCARCVELFIAPSGREYCLLLPGELLTEDLKRRCPREVFGI